MQERVQINFAQRWQYKLDAPKRAAAKRRKTILLRVIAGVLVIALGSLPWLYEYKLSTELAVLNQQIEDKQDLDSILYYIEDLEMQIDSQEQVLEQIVMGRKNPSEILKQLQEDLSQDSVLESFTLNNDNSLNVAITFNSPIDAANFWSSMGDSEYFFTEDISTLSLEDKKQTLSMTFRLR